MDFRLSATWAMLAWLLGGVLKTPENMPLILGTSAKARSRCGSHDQEAPAAMATSVCGISPSALERPAG